MNDVLTKNAIDYIIKVYFNIMGIVENYRIEVDYEESSITVIINGVYIKFSIMDDNELRDFVEGNYHVKLIKTNKNEVPFFVKKDDEIIRKKNSKLEVMADMITPAFILISRKEEVLIPSRDKYDRFLYEYSISKKYGLIDMPIVDEWAYWLKEQILHINNIIKLEEYSPSLKPTHDIDLIRRFDGTYKSIKSLFGGDLFLRKSLKIFMNSLKMFIASRKNALLDPEYLGMERLLKLSKEKNLQSDFYFMGIEKEEDDYRYSIFYTQAKAFADYAIKEGMRCGFHGSRKSSKSIEIFNKEQTRVENALGFSCICNRQHYLCFDAILTPEIWEKQGIRDDYTLGYPDREGFMCGTCRPFYVYDLKNDRATNVLEHPLIVMDVTVRDRFHSTIECLDKLKILMNNVIDVKGEFVILWHNSNIFRGWENWYYNVYKKFVLWSVKRIEDSR